MSTGNDEAAKLAAQLIQQGRIDDAAKILNAINGGIDIDNAVGKVTDTARELVPQYLKFAGIIVACFFVVAILIALIFMVWGA
jgi:hypothetical protein